ncbi:120_t:CDS:2 [Rhizophagus irregularis]|nr:120_t:CDS:2 [Rhizophagus irregularis]
MFEATTGAIALLGYIGWNVDVDINFIHKETSSRTTSVATYPLHSPLYSPAPPPPPPYSPPLSFDPYIDKFSIKISTGTNINLLKTAVREDIKVPDLMFRGECCNSIGYIHRDFSRTYQVALPVSYEKVLIRLDKEGNAEVPKHAQKLIRTSSFEELIWIERYLREHSTPTSTEEEVQNWFNGLMMELPSFKRKILVESTHNDPYLDGFKPAAIRNPPDDQVSYEGTISFASPDILNNNLNQSKAIDDLHSFVRSMYILHNRLKFPKINPNDTFASKAQVIIEFWDDSVNIKLDGPLWKEMDINEPFATFYNNYVEAIDNAMTKNFASCALGALLKGKDEDLF